MAAHRSSYGLVLAVALAAAGTLDSRPARAGGDEEAEPADPEARLRSRMTRGPGTTDAKAVTEWSQAMAREGRARAGTPFGGDLLSAAALALTSRRLDGPAALALWREASASYAEGAVGRTRAWWEIASALSSLGDAEGSLVALDEFERRMAQGTPVDASGPDRLLFESLEGPRSAWAPLVRAGNLSALGRHADAAALYESLADRPRGDLAESASAWDQAAHAAWRAGDPARAERDITTSIALTTDDAHVVWRRHWLLRSHFGLLDERGEPRLAPSWPGDAFMVELRSALAAVSGRKSAFELALQGATIAVLCARHEEALELFGWAFRDPSFQAEAGDSDIDRRRLLTGADEALRAGRPDLAMAWLEAAERFAGAPIAGTESLRIAIEEALDSKKPSEPGSPRGGPPAEAPESPGSAGAGQPRRARGRLGPAAADAPVSPVPEAADTVAPPSGLPGALLVAALVALVSLASAWAIRRRTRSPP